MDAGTKHRCEALPATRCDSIHAGHKLGAAYRGEVTFATEWFKEFASQQ